MIERKVEIAVEDPDQREVASLLQASDAYMASLYPAESNHMLDVASLRQPQVTFLVARVDGKALGCGAVVDSGEGWAEVKRMFVSPAARGLKLGRRLLDEIEAIAARRGNGALRLEMGGLQHEAMRLYRAAGFVEIGPFGAYNPDPLSIFMEKTLTSAYTPTPRTRVKRLNKRAVYDKARVHEILDEGFLCHVGFVRSGQPFVIPTLYARSGETLYIHGSGVSGMLKRLAEGVEVCVTVTLVDGYVLARSAFHHSMNYRSVVILGSARLVSKRQEMLHALEVITDHVVPGRWAEVRAPNELEMKQTAVLALPLEEVSAKVRVGPPIDDDEDYALSVWAGVVPIGTAVAEPIPDGRVPTGVEAPPLSRFTRFRR